MFTLRRGLVVVGPALALAIFLAVYVRTSNAQVNPEAFRRKIDGSQVELYTLKNKNGLEATITNYGGIVVSLSVPDKNGKLGDVVLGYDTLNDYIGNTPYFGSLIGRYGNRIAKGRFTISGVDYQLAQNNAENSLHGGRKGFDKVVWQAEKLDTPEGPALKLTYTSKDGEENYPGTLRCEVIYTLTNNNELKIQYTAETDKPTFVNLTHHSYFNLKDAGASDILGHELMIKSDKFTPVDKGLIPTGELRPVAGTPFDFNKPTAIGARVESDDEQMKFGKGYDHNWVLNRQGKDLELVASLYEPTTGRFMEVLTTEPGLQFYVRQLSRRDKQRQGWHRLPTPDWPLFRDAAFSRFTKPAGLSHNRVTAG